MNRHHFDSTVAENDTGLRKQESPLPRDLVPIEWRRYREQAPLYCAMLFYVVWAELTFCDRVIQFQVLDLNDVGLRIS